MQINPAEVTKILKEQIKKFGEKAEVSEVGQIGRAHVWTPVT